MDSWGCGKDIQAQGWVWVLLWPVGVLRRPRRHGDDGEAHGCTMGLQRGGHGVRVSYPWLQRIGWARQGGARRSQWTWPRWSGARVGGGGALAGGLVLWPVVATVVWCSGLWSGALAGGLVLWPVVATPRRRRCERDEPVLCLGVRGAWRGLQRPRARRWSRCARECAVLVCLETGDGLGLRAHGMERHGQLGMVQR